MAPTSEILTAERILEATEEVLRRHGPAKATVVDVARALGVSHGSVYRRFRTKAALREAVTKRWLDRTSGELSGIVAADRDPETRLRTGSPHCSPRSTARRATTRSCSPRTWSSPARTARRSASTSPT